MKKIFAFTLAEVLITLSILGVVAAITVPSLIKRQHRNEVETKIRKMYSTVTAALDQAEANEGKGYAMWQNENDAGVFTRKYIIPYLNIQKECYTAAGVDNKECKSYTRYRQDGKTVVSTEPPCFVLKDGTTIQCTYKRSGSDPSTKYGNSIIGFDINGPKGPNVNGKDFFYIMIFEDEKTGSYYFGGENWNKASKDISKLKNSCNTEKSSGVGHMSCSTWIYANGLKIPKDYPFL